MENKDKPTEEIKMADQSETKPDDFVANGPVFEVGQINFQPQLEFLKCLNTMQIPYTHPSFNQTELFKVMMQIVQSPNTDE